MSFLRCAVVAMVCFAGMLAGVNASGFSAQFTPAGGALSLQNGPNFVNTFSAWNTNNAGGFSDGQFQNDGAYSIPVNGVYHFDATLDVVITQQSQSPLDQTVDLRIVKCNIQTGCNAFCLSSGLPTNTIVGTTLVTAGINYIGVNWPLNGAAQPSYSLSASFTGIFNTGDVVGLCVDSASLNGVISLACNSAGKTNSCVFSGFGL